jgi:hypothetical protein
VQTVFEQRSSTPATAQASVSAKRSHGTAPARWDRIAVTLGALLCFIAPGARAQTSAAMGPRSQLQYAANESGGRIRLVIRGHDSVAVESVRLELLEAAAAIRRGDLRMVRVLRRDSPALLALAERRTLIRCTYRAVPGGGELVLLSDDGSTVRAIHTLLAQAPPET